MENDTLLQKIETFAKINNEWGKAQGHADKDFRYGTPKEYKTEGVPCPFTTKEGNLLNELEALGCSGKLIGFIRLGAQTRGKWDAQHERIESTGRRAYWPKRLFNSLNAKRR